ncbi:unnamed protein product [Prunus brigantina]
MPARSTVRRDGSYDILMNGFSLHSTTTPRKAIKGIESALQKNIICSVGGFWFGVGPFECSLELSIYRGSPRGTLEAEKICMVEPDRGK